MEILEFVISMLLILIIYIAIIKIWMIIANKIGEIIGFSRFIEWIANKFKAYFS